jgi:hypothetical protein
VLCPSKGIDETLEIFYMSVLIRKLKRPGSLMCKCIKIVFSRDTQIPGASPPWRLLFVVGADCESSVRK